MSVRCGETHPERPDEAGCAASEGPHVQHVDRAGRRWENVAVVEEEARRVTSRSGALDFARQAARRTRRATRAR